MVPDESVPGRLSFYALGAIGVVALLAGTLSLLRVSPVVAHYLPEASVALGIVALGATFAPTARSRFDHARRTTLRASEKASSSNAAKESHERRTRKVTGDPAAPVPRSGIGHATTASIAKAGDELWSHWAVPKSGSLGAPLVGPVRETAYSQSSPGAAAAFSTMDQDIVFLSESLVRLGGGDPSRVAVPASRTGRTRWSASASIAGGVRRGDHEVPALRTPAGTGGGTLASGPHSGEWESLATGHPGLLPMLDSSEYVDAGAPPTTGRAPVVRSWAALVQEEPRSRGSPVEAGIARLCRDCSRRLTDFREWVHCRRCATPLCRDCLSDSLTHDDRGYCVQCRESSGHLAHREPNGRRWPSDTPGRGS